MATTLKLIDTHKIDIRRNGDISYAKVTVLIDGLPYTTDFRCRVDEEAVLIDGDTITVSDMQVEESRKHLKRIQAEHIARTATLEAALTEELSRLDTFLDEKNATPEARAELHALFRANPESVTSLAYSTFREQRTAIMRRYGLIG
ncbi:MAG: hypothetical protein ACTMKV_04175 [Sphingomonas parapaucimobilis]